LFLTSLGGLAKGISTLGSSCSVTSFKCLYTRMVLSTSSFKSSLETELSSVSLGVSIRMSSSKLGALLSS